MGIRGVWRESGGKIYLVFAVLEYDVTRIHNLTPDHHNVERTRNKRNHPVEQGPPKGWKRPEGPHPQSQPAIVRHEFGHLYLRPRPPRPARFRLLYLPYTQGVMTLFQGQIHCRASPSLKDKLAHTVLVVCSKTDNHSIRKHCRG